MQHGGDISADVYGVRGLRYGKDFVRDELSRAQFVVGRDPLNGNPFQVDEAGISQATRRQQQFYSNQGVFADMPGSFPVDGEDRGVWAGCARSARLPRSPTRCSAARSGRTGGTKIDTLERAETRFIEPMGVHNREKESLRIKSMNKSIWAMWPRAMRFFRDGLHRPSGVWSSLPPDHSQPARAVRRPA